MLRSGQGYNLGELGLAAGVVLRLGADLDVSRLVDDLLHGVLNELVEGVELLADEALLLEVGGDDGPGILLGDLLLVSQVTVPLHVLVHLVPVPAATITRLVVLLCTVPSVPTAVVVPAITHLHTLLVLVVLHGRRIRPRGWLAGWLAGRQQREEVGIWVVARFCASASRLSREQADAFRGGEVELKTIARFGLQYVRGK